MSKGDNMGLFGSKDEHNESINEEKIDADNSKANPSDRYAPYNMDSDSETYDTEALSMMDINDIIGVQADAPGDSTLESEFAALSEIITDSKDDEVDGIRPGGAFGTLANAEIRKTDQNSAGVTSISKSLQLIGEAYISEDSQETDTEDVEKSREKKTSASGESIKAATSLKDDDKTPGTDCSEQKAKLETDISPRIVGLENAGGPSEDSTTGRTKKSEDSTDSVVSDNLRKPEATNVECMDVDLSALHEKAMKGTTVSENHEKPIESTLDIDKNAEPKIESPIIEVEKPISNLGEIEESMEVDEPSKILACVETAEKPIENDSEPSDRGANSETPTTTEILDLKPVVSEKPLDDLEDDPKISPEQKNIAKKPNLEEKASSESADEKCDEETSVIHKIDSAERKRSKSPQKEEISMEVERDESPLDKPVLGAVEPKTPEESIKESTIEQADGKSSTDDQKSAVSSEKVLRTSESPERPEKIEKIIDESKTVVKPENVIEPMEIDEPEQQEKEKAEPPEIPEKILDGSSKNVESQSDLAPEPKTDEEHIEKTLASTTDSPRIHETFEKDPPPESTLTKSFIEKSMRTAEAAKKPSESDDVVPPKSFAGTTSNELLDQFTDDEKMEVDGKSKHRKVEEELEVSQAIGSLKEEEKSTTKKEESNKTMQKHVSVDTVDDAAPAQPEVQLIIAKSISSESFNQDAGDVKLVVSAVEGNRDGGEESVEAREKAEEPDDSKSIEVLSDISENERIPDGEKGIVSIGEKTESKSSTQDPHSIADGNCQSVDSALLDGNVEKVVSDEKDACEEFSKEKTQEIENGKSTETISQDTARGDKEKKEMNSTSEGRKALISEEGIESSVKQNQIQDQKMIGDAVENKMESQAMKIRSEPPEEKADRVIYSQKLEVANEEPKESSVSSKIPDPSNVEGMKNIISSETAESSVVEKNNKICFEKTESTAGKGIEACEEGEVSKLADNSTLPEKMETSNTEEDRDLLVVTKSEKDFEKFNSPEQVDSLEKEEERTPLIDEEIRSLHLTDRQSSSNEKTEEFESMNIEKNENVASIKKDESSDTGKQENFNTQAHAQSNSNSKEKTACLNKEERKPSIYDGTIESTSTEEKEPITSSGILEFTIDEEKELITSSAITESSNTEDKEQLNYSGITELSNEENEISSCPAKSESPEETEAESSTCLDKVENLAGSFQDPKVTESQIPVESSSNNEPEASSDTDIKLSLLVEEPMDCESNVETIIEQEEKVSLMPETTSGKSSRSDLTKSSTNLSDRPTEEDDSEDEMNSSTEPEDPDTPETRVEKNSRTIESFGKKMYEDPDEIGEDNTAANLPLGRGEKTVETNFVQPNDCPVESSTYKSEESYGETQGKSAEDPDDNLKDILSTSSVCVTQIFNDDEQSQSTQEMMESILETDKGNINKILDEQEADDLESSEINSMEKLPKESDDMLNKALEDPIGSQNIDSLEGLLDLDLMPENDEPNLKVVEPMVDKVIQESCDIETIGKHVDVSLLMEVSDTIGNRSRSEEFDARIATKIMDKADEEIASTVNELMKKSSIEVTTELEDNSNLTEKDLEAFDLASVVAGPLESVDPSEETKINLAEDLLREIAVDEETKIKLTEKLLLEDNIPEQDLLLSPSIEGPAKIDIPDEVFLPVETERDMELAEDISLDSAVRDQVLNEVAAEIENLPPSSEISELESAVKFLQESEEQDIDSPLVLSPKIIEDVVDEIAVNSDVGIFASGDDICADPSELVAELESIIPDPIAISEAEIINEAAKLEIERKTKLSEATKLSSPTKVELVEEIFGIKSPTVDSVESSKVTGQLETPEIPKKSREIIETSPEQIVHEPLKKSAPIPKVSILEERLKVPPKIEIPVGEVSRICELPTTPKTSLLIQRDVKSMNLTKQMDSPKSMDKTELKIVDTPRKESEKNDFENVGSPRIILKIAKSAIADCAEPRSPKSPKIRSATNSPNPEDSPGQKLGKIKLKLSKGGHPSIISNENIDEHCGQWHTEGSLSLSPLGMKIKFSKIPDNSNLSQADKHDTDEPREQPSKHKFEEAKRTESPLGMKIKLSRTGDPSIVQHDTKESSPKHKEKLEIMQQDSPKRTESPIGMKIKLSKSGDASIVQPDKQETSDEHRDGSLRNKEKLEISQQHCERNDAPRRTESPLGMKFKLFKTGDASIVQPDAGEDNQQDIKRTDSPVSKKSKASKTRASASTIVAEQIEEMRAEKLEVSEAPKRTESPLGMKIKLSKRGDASIIHNEETRDSPKQRAEVVQETAQITEGSLKMKVSKASTLQPEVTPEIDCVPGTGKRADPTIGMKIKLSKSGDASIVHPEKEETFEEPLAREKSENLQESIRKIDPAIGMKIKLSKTGDASIVPSQSTKKSDEQSIVVETRESEASRGNDASTGVKIKLQKGGEGSMLETERKEKTTRRKEMEMPLEMKIKISKTGHPTIVACNENILEASPQPGSTKQSPSSKENTGMKMLKSMHGASLHGVRSELTIEPVHSRKVEIEESVTKRKDITISPVESKKTKLEAKLSQILPEVTIQPVIPREQKQQIKFESKSGSISRQQMNVISQEISITQVRTNKPVDLSMTDKLKSMLTKNTGVPSHDCEIIEHRPELIIVNENSNSSQDVMIIEEVAPIRGPENKIPKKRGRPRRNPLPLILAKPQSVAPIEPITQRDPLALDEVVQMATHMGPQIFPPKENEAQGRPKRTCRSQKSYAPPRRGRGRGGRGKRKMDMDIELVKRPRIDQDLDMIERSTTALITIHDPPPGSSDIIDEMPAESSHGNSELYKALRQPTMDRKMPNAIARDEVEQAGNDPRNDPELMTKENLESLMDARIMSHLDGVINTSIKKIPPGETFEEKKTSLLVDISSTGNQTSGNSMPGEMGKSEVSTIDDKSMEKIVDESKENKDSSSAMDHENWLTPSSRKQCDGRNEGNISNVQVMDEETRMSAESSSRSQTPAKNMSVQAPETIVNEESQGSVLSTATTESEKVKVKNRRMEINFDPDEGPFTVDKVAEYDWPLDPMKKNETFMIQEQISHYLGVKSFKRKYPDLKRRMVDMEERNFLRENALVSEAMCDMGLTAVLSSEVLDIMCSDFPDQYEEYRKYIREKQMKEHFKKQKELTAAANAEKNRIDLAEMAVQSALSWNVGLNKARRESRKCSLDLQTFTIHVPKKQQKIEEDSGGNHYPVALIPGQYTDYYREYTPAELRYYPLNTVLYGPMRPNERKFDSQSEGSQSDSDSDSSSDDSSSSSSEGTQDTEASQSTMDDVDAELTRQKDDIKCKMCLKHLNKFSRTEILIQCGTCNGYVHPSCIDLTLDMVPHIQAYAWQCTDCKTCAQCHDPADEDKMLFCDMCDRGYHIYCVGLRRVPQGRWHCQECAVCASCGSREAGGANSDRNSVAQWQHEYKKGDKNTRVYVSTLCVPCSKLWRKGRYCPHCSRCHTVQRLDLEANLVHCSACDKYLHLGCVETKDLTIDRKNYRCDFCQPLRHHMINKPLVSKVLRT